MAELASVPDLPPLGAHVWAYYIDIAQGRQNNGMALSRISRLEIQAWERDEMFTLDPWERSALIQIDSAYLAQSTEPDEAHEEA